LVTYTIVWTLRSVKNPNRVTRHVYNGLTLSEVCRQLDVCAKNSVGALEDGFEPKIDVYTEEE